MTSAPHHAAPGFLLLEDGTLFLGRLHAPLATPAVAEVVFTTTMSGYQETITHTT
ncbi:MAG: carbamoyl-phosphate synthase domain-containing protein [Gemmatimonadota bacterium]